MKVKLTRCHLCHATKVRRSPTAYIYCDYCGALTDFDFQLAISDTRSKLPGPAYEALNKGLTPQLKQAQEQNDRGAYLALQRKLYDAYVTACPAACPPRVNDAVYRAKYVEYSAQTSTEVVFNPTWAAASARQSAAMKALAWVPGPKGVTARSDTFWALYDTVVEMREVGARVGAAQGFDALNPDGDTPVNAKLGDSLFAQGWLPYLREADAKALLERAGLAAQYVEPEPVAHETLPCGACGKAVERLDGAKRCVCDACGHLLQADLAVSCGQCSAKLLRPAEHTTFGCPFCATELRSMTWTTAQLQC